MRISMSLFFCLMLATQTAIAAPASAPAKNSQSIKPQSQAKLDDSKANPRSLEANDRGLADLKKGDMKGAEDEFKRAIEIDPGNLTAAYNLSGTYIVNEKRDAALNMLREYTQKYPFDAGLWARYGDVNFSAERVKEAIASYEKAFALDMKYPNLAARMGLAYALDQRIADSERMYRLAVNESPKDGELLTNLSNILIGTGKFDEAITYAQRSAQINPTSRAFVTLGSAYEANHNSKQALAAFERAHELGDKSEDLTTKILELKKHIA